MPEIYHFFQQLVNGLTIGSTYALIAIGYTMVYGIIGMINFCLLYTSPSPRDQRGSRMPSSA